MVSTEVPVWLRILRVRLSGIKGEPVELLLTICRQTISFNSEVAMRTRISSVAALVAVLLSGMILPTVEARQPFQGSFRGDCTRKVPSARPKKKKIKAHVQTEQTGGPYDARTTVNASGGGEKVNLVLDFREDNSLTVTVNGQAFSGNLRPNKGRVPQASKKFRYKGKFTGSATFVGPLKQNLSATGKMKGTSTKLTGSVDLQGDVFILKLNLKSTAASPLGAKSSFQVRATRE